MNLILEFKLSQQKPHIITILDPTNITCYNITLKLMLLLQFLDDMDPEDGYEETSDGRLLLLIQYFKNCTC